MNLKIWNLHKVISEYSAISIFTFCGKKNFHIRTISIEMGAISISSICVELVLTLCFLLGSISLLSEKFCFLGQNNILNHSQSFHAYLFWAVRGIRFKIQLGLVQSISKNVKTLYICLIYNWISCIIDIDEDLQNRQDGKCKMWSLKTLIHF